MSIALAGLELEVGRPARRSSAVPNFPPRAGLPHLLQELVLSTMSVGPGKGEPIEKSAAENRDWSDVLASRGGDGDAFERIVRRYQDPIGAYLWRFTRDRLQWEELLQDVFVEAYLGLGGYAGRAPLLHWLKRIATRIGYRYWKRRDKHRTEVPLLPVAEILAAPPTSNSARDAAELVHQLLARLGPRDRLVMTLCYLEDCSLKEMAELTGWTETMVKVQSHRARKRLAKLYERWENEQ